MSIQRAYARKLMLSLFSQDATYNSGPAGWTSGEACQMSEYAPDSRVQWDDGVFSDEDSVSGFELATHQEIALQGLALQYNEPRAKPNTLAGLMGLALGDIAAAVQDGAHDAWRHRVGWGNAFELPSIGAQAQHDGGAQFLYTGLKAGGYTLARSGPYWSYQTQIMGSGERAEASDAFVARIEEKWLRWGDSKIYLKETGIPITVPTTPSQTTANLGGSEIDVSTRFLTFSHAIDNTLQGDLGYRASSGQVRHNLHPSRRTASVTFSLECDNTKEADDLDRYLQQTKFALEVNCNSGILIDDAGVFKFGFIVIFPFLQLQPFNRGEEQERDTLEFTAKIMDDLSNQAIVAFIYNAQPAYLAESGS
jgi:hypothetical protein